LRKAIILSTFLIALPANLLWAGGAGIPGAVVLEHPVGARASGMAEAYTAVGGEIGVLHYNPAGLISLPGREASFTYQRGLAEDSFMGLLYGQPTRLGVFAGGFFYYTVGEMELIDLDGNEWSVKGEQDFAVVGSFARRLLDRFPIGVNLKIISSRLVEAESGTAFAIDFGSLYHPPLEGMTLGLAVRNLGTKIKFIDEGDSLPLIISVGGLLIARSS